MLHASELVVYDGREEVVRHERLIARNGSRLELDHYLEALIRKPGALPGATALDQARTAGHSPELAAGDARAYCVRSSYSMQNRETTLDLKLA